MKIVPIKTGQIYCNQTTITLGKGYGDWISVPATAWYIETAQEKILVDTGMCSTDFSDQHHYKGSVQNEDERIDLALKKEGIEPEEINKVIFTHLHWDHCQNLHFFKQATFYVQRKEWESAVNPIPPYFNSYEAEQIGLTPAFKNISFQFLEGDTRILEGVQVLFTPGHSAGHQSVLIETSEGNYVIAGDAIMSYENLKPNQERNLEFTLIGRYMDVEKTWNSMGKIKSLADFILPGHEPKVFSRKEYP